jgi:hypothetical protein
MYRLVPALIAVALLGAACGSDEPSPASSGHADLADLTITVDRDGDKSAPPRQLTLTCKAPTDSDACGAAAGVSAADLAPTPDGTACTQIFGGPQTATIKGTIRGDAVDASFSRKDGCEIERWARVDPLLAQVK